MVLLLEPMPHVRSATAVFLTPCGNAYDPADQLGLAGLLAGMSTRGAGDRDNRELSLALDNLGADRGENVGALNTAFSAGSLARDLPAVLDIYADILRRPHLPADELEPLQMQALQDLQGIEDSPQELAMIELGRRYYPSPLNRHTAGTVEGVEAATVEAVRELHRRQVRPNGTILAVAGNVGWDALRDRVEGLFADWPQAAETPVVPDPPAPQSWHIEKDTQQTHIGLAFPSVPRTDPDYFAARGAVEVLSAGFSSRLFTAMRERDGLCYAASASYVGMKDRGSVFGYTGTRPDRAQKALGVMLTEFRRLADGVEADELERVQAGLKTSLIMQQESTAARARGIAADWYYLGRVRPVEEIQGEIDGLSPTRIAAHLARHPLTTPTVVTVGPAALEIQT
jgi:predicted Zn-dependent peptidase